MMKSLSAAFLPVYIALVAIIHPITPLTKQGIFDRALASLVRVSHEAPENKTYTCTGFIVDAARGWVLTAKHCIDDKVDTFVNFEIPASIVKTDDQFALLHVTPMMGPPVRFAKKTHVLDQVLAIGYGYSTLQVFIRSISALPDDDVILDGPFAPGMSGGPLYNEEGEVVGLIQATTSSVGLACGVKEIKKFLKLKD